MAGPTSTPHVARLGEVSFPVRLYKAAGDPKETKFDKAGPNGGRLVEHVVQEGRSGSPGVAAVTELREAGSTEALGEGVELRQGVFLPDDRFVDLTEHLTAIDEEEKLEEFEILAFIRREALPIERVQGAYWLAPDDTQAARVLRLLHDVCRESHRAAVVAWTKNKNRAEGVVIAHHSGALLVVEIAFPENAREVPPLALAPKTVDVTPEQVDAARALVQSMSEPPDVLEEIEDDRRRRRAELRAIVEATGRAPELAKPEEVTVSEEATALLAALS